MGHHARLGNIEFLQLHPSRACLFLQFTLRFTGTESAALKLFLKKKVCANCFAEGQLSLFMDLLQSLIRLIALYIGKKYLGFCFVSMLFLIGI